MSNTRNRDEQPKTKKGKGKEKQSNKGKRKDKKKEVRKAKTLPKTKKQKLGKEGNLNKRGHVRWGDYILVDEDVYETYQHDIDNFLQGSDKGYERLNAANKRLKIRSIKTSQGGRLVLIKERDNNGKLCSIVFEELPTHQHDRCAALSLNNQSVFHALNKIDKDSYLTLDEKGKVKKSDDYPFLNDAQSNVPKSLLKKYKKTFNLARNMSTDFLILTQQGNDFLIFSDQQSSTLEKKAPLVGKGHAGSGKTSVAFSNLSKAYEEESLEKKSIRVIVENERLKKEYVKNWQETKKATDRHNVTFVTRDEYLKELFLKNEPGTNEEKDEKWEKRIKLNALSFYAWADKETRDNLIKDFKGKNKPTKENFPNLKHIYQEFRVISGYSKEEYLSKEVGKRQSLFSENKEFIYYLYENYQQHLTDLRKRNPDIIVIDPALYQYDLEKIPEKYDVLIVDEAQDFSLGELQLFYHSTKEDRQCYFFLDNNQSKDFFAKDPYFLKLMKNDLLPGESPFITLTQSYRCIGTRQIANATLELKYLFTGGKIDKTDTDYMPENPELEVESQDEIALIPDVTDELKKLIKATDSIVIFFPKDGMTEKDIDDERGRLITLYGMRDDSDPKKKDKDYPVLTPDEVKGLECFDNAILHQPFSTDAFYKMDRELVGRLTEMSAKGKEKATASRSKETHSVYDNAPHYSQDFYDLYIALTRAPGVIMVQSEDEKVRNILEFYKKRVRITTELFKVTDTESAEELFAKYKKLIKNSRISRAKVWLRQQCQLSDEQINSVLHEEIKIALEEGDHSLAKQIFVEGFNKSLFANDDKAEFKALVDQFNKEKADLKLAQKSIQANIEVIGKVEEKTEGVTEHIIQLMESVEKEKQKQLALNAAIEAEKLAKGQIRVTSRERNAAHRKLSDAYENEEKAQDALDDMETNLVEEKQAILSLVKQQEQEKRDKLVQEQFELERINQKYYALLKQKEEENLQENIKNAASQEESKRQEFITVIEEKIKKEEPKVAAENDEKVEATKEDSVATQAIVNETVEKKEEIQEEKQKENVDNQEKTLPYLCCDALIGQCTEYSIREITALGFGTAVNKCLNNKNYQLALVTCCVVKEEKFYARSLRMVQTIFEYKDVINAKPLNISLTKRYKDKTPIEHAMINKNLALVLYLIPETYKQAKEEGNENLCQVISDFIKEMLNKKLSEFTSEWHRKGFKPDFAKNACLQNLIIHISDKKDIDEALFILLTCYLFANTFHAEELNLCNQLASIVFQFINELGLSLLDEVSRKLPYVVLHKSLYLLHVPNDDLLNLYTIVRKKTYQQARESNDQKTVEAVKNIAQTQLIKEMVDYGLTYGSNESKSISNDLCKMLVNKEYILLIKSALKLFQIFPGFLKSIICYQQELEIPINDPEVMAYIKSFQDQFVVTNIHQFLLDSGVYLVELEGKLKVYQKECPLAIAQIIKLIQQKKYVNALCLAKLIADANLSKKVFDTIYQYKQVFNIQDEALSNHPWHKLITQQPPTSSQSLPPVTRPSNETISEKKVSANKEIVDGFIDQADLVVQCQKALLIQVRSFKYPDIDNLIKYLEDGKYNFFLHSCCVMSDKKRAYELIKAFYTYKHIFKVTALYSYGSFMSSPKTSIEFAIEKENHDLVLFLIKDAFQEASEKNDTKTCGLIKEYLRNRLLSALEDIKNADDNWKNIYKNIEAKKYQEGFNIFFKFLESTKNVAQIDKVVYLLDFFLKFRKELNVSLDESVNVELIRGIRINYFRNLTITNQLNRLFNLYFSETNKQCVKEMITEYVCDLLEAIVKREITKENNSAIKEKYKIVLEHIKKKDYIAAICHCPNFNKNADSVEVYIANLFAFRVILGFSVSGILENIEKIQGSAISLNSKILNTIKAAAEVELVKKILSYEKESPEVVRQILQLISEKYTSAVCFSFLISDTKFAIKVISAFSDYSMEVHVKKNSICPILKKSVLECENDFRERNSNNVKRPAITAATTTTTTTIPAKVTTTTTTTTITTSAKPNTESQKAANSGTTLFNHPFQTQADDLKKREAKKKSAHSELLKKIEELHKNKKNGGQIINLIGQRKYQEAIWKATEINNKSLSCDYVKLILQYKNILEFSLSDEKEAETKIKKIAMKNSDLHNLLQTEVEKDTALKKIYSSIDNEALREEVKKVVGDSQSDESLFAAICSINHMDIQAVVKLFITHRKVLNISTHGQINNQSALMIAKAKGDLGLCTMLKAVAPVILLDTMPAALKTHPLVTASLSQKKYVDAICLADKSLFEKDCILFIAHLLKFKEELDIRLQEDQILALMKEAKRQNRKELCQYLAHHQLIGTIEDQIVSNPSVDELHEILAFIKVKDYLSALCKATMISSSTHNEMFNYEILKLVFRNIAMYAEFLNFDVTQTSTVFHKTPENCYAALEEKYSFLSSSLSRMSNGM